MEEEYADNIVVKCAQMKTITVTMRMIPPSERQEK